MSVCIYNINILNLLHYIHIMQSTMNNFISTSVVKHDNVDISAIVVSLYTVDTHTHIYGFYKPTISLVSYIREL